MYNVYVLKSSLANKIYIGHSKDCDSRLQQHQAGSSQATVWVNDWKLIYQEAFPTRSLAMKREAYFKTGDGRRVLKLKGVL